MTLKFFLTRFGPDQLDGIFLNHLDMAFNGELFLVSREQLRFSGHYKFLYSHSSSSFFSFRSRSVLGGEGHRLFYVCSRFSYSSFNFLAFFDTRACFLRAGLIAYSELTAPRCHGGGLAAHSTLGHRDDYVCLNFRRNFTVSMFLRDLRRGIVSRRIQLGCISCNDLVA